MNLDSALSKFFSQSMAAVHTALPGTVVSYDAERHTAEVAPAIRTMQEDGVLIELPDLLDVPVLFPTAKSWSIEFHLDKGDGVLLVFLEADASAWREGDGSTEDAATSTRFGLDSAVAIPGLKPGKSDGKASVVVDKDGVLTFKAKKTVFDGPVVMHDNLIVRDDIFVGQDTAGQSFNQHIHPTPVGPSSPASPPIPNPKPEV